MISPGQATAIHFIELASALYRQGNIVTVRWIPGHRVESNEVTDAYARQAIEAPVSRRPSPRHPVSLAYLKRQRTEKAASLWAEEKESRTFKFPFPRTGNRRDGH